MTRLRKRNGAILIMTIFFTMLCLIMLGVIVDITRLQLAKHQLRLVADSTALAAVNNWQLATYIYTFSPRYRQIYFIKQSPRDCWLLDVFSLLMVPEYYPNSMFPDRNGKAFQQRSGPGFPNEPCVTIYDIADVYAKLNSSTKPFELAGFESLRAYQFEPDTVRVISVDVREGSNPELMVGVEAKVKMFFTSILGVNDVTIREYSSATIQILTGGN